MTATNNFERSLKYSTIFVCNFSSRIHIYYNICNKNRMLFAIESYEKWVKVRLEATGNSTASSGKVCHAIFRFPSLC